jgi:hypothetical protein
MSGQWKEVVRLAFKGRRYRDHALDLSAITELSQFQKMVAETAKALWRAANPDRERLPKRFEERTRLCLRTIEEGSAVAPLEVYIEEPEVPELFEPEPTEIKEAVSLVQHVYRAVERDEPLPDNFPKALVSEYERWGQGLSEDEAIEVITADQELVRVTQVSRARLATFVEGTHEGYVDVTGEVLEADVRLQVIGVGEFSPQGKPLRITRVERLQIQPVGEVAYDSTARPIEDVLADLAREVPRENWNRLPSDLTDNLDHYLYGTPKQ